MENQQGNPHAPIDDGDRPPTDKEILEMAVRELLIEKEVFTAGDIQKQIETMDATTPAGGARIVAKYWADEEFRAFAQRNGRAAVESMGFEMPESPELLILENTPRQHNVVVCTLCSCYPRMVLGLPPAWYKSKAYRSRVVNEPRAVLEEFGTMLPSDVEIKVSDSTAELRYLVVPVRPEGTEDWSEDQLAKLITRDSMIGVTVALSPSEV